MPRAQDDIQGCISVAGSRMLEATAQDAYMEVGGTIPWMESVESSLEQRPRKCREHVFERRVIGD